MLKLRSHSTRRLPCAIRAAAPAASTTNLIAPIVRAAPMSWARSRSPFLALGNTVDAALEAYDIVAAAAGKPDGR